MSFELAKRRQMIPKLGSEEVEPRNVISRPALSVAKEHFFGHEELLYDPCTIRPVRRTVYNSVI